MSDQSKADGKVPIAPQAALNEYAALVEHYRNRNLLLAQQVHELGATVEILRGQLEGKKGKA